MNGVFASMPDPLHSHQEVLANLGAACDELGYVLVELHLDRIVLRPTGLGERPLLVIELPRTWSYRGPFPADIVRRYCAKLNG